MPSNEYNKERRNQTIVVAISMLIIFGVLLLTINRLMDSRIIKGINNIISSLSGITAGDFDITINEHGNPEFEQLSDSINKMVNSIRSGMQENVQLLEQQKADVEKITEMVRQNVNTLSDAMKQIDRISTVVETNVEISQNTKLVSPNMAEITAKLLEMVES